MRYLNPDTLAPPRGYSNGVLMRAGTAVLFVAGQIGWDAEKQLVSDSIAEQFDQALGNVLAVVGAAGSAPEAIGRLTIFVTRLEEYVAEMKEIGRRYRARMGQHYPAMTLVEVKALLEPGAKVEIEATACI